MDSIFTLLIGSVENAAEAGNEKLIEDIKAVLQEMHEAVEEKTQGY